MIVYHGSNMIVDHPRLVRQNRTLDFGYGFYTTFNKDQAVNFAEKVTARRETGKEALTRLYASELYRQLEREETKLWHLSIPTLYEMWLEEKESGHITYPEEV